MKREIKAKIYLQNLSIENIGVRFVLLINEFHKQLFELTSCNIHIKKPNGYLRS